MPARSPTPPPRSQRHDHLGRPTPRPSTAVQSPALTIDKTVDAGDRTTAVGDVITYSYLVTNTRQRDPDGAVHGQRRHGDAR